MSTHSELAPSSAHRWVNCPGSVALSRQFPDVETPEAAEGTAAHWIGAERLYGRTIQVGEPDPAGTVTTREQYDSAAVWVEDVQRHAGDLGLIQHLQIEQSVPIPQVHQACHGTPDTWLWDERTRTLFVWDFKHGHQWVEAPGNWQAVPYVAGALGLLGIDERNCDGVRVVFTIVQPRAYGAGGPVRRWVFDAAELWPLVYALRHAALEAMGSDPRCVPGTWCVDCPAAVGCRALNRTLSSAIVWVTGATPERLSPADMAAQHELLKLTEGLLKARLSGLRGTIEATVQRGGYVPGWAFEPVEGRLKWDIPASEVLALGMMHGKSLSKGDTITPTQAIAAGIPADIVAKYASRPRGMELTDSPKLAARAAKEFGK